MMKHPADRIASAVQKVLPAGWVVRAESIEAQGLSFAVTVAAAKIKHTFIAGWAGEGWPADVERLVALAGEVDVVVARDLSVGARQWLADRDLGWVDEAGRANVALPSGLVLVREVSVPSLKPSTHGDRWPAATVAAAEAILSGTVPRVREIEHVTGYSRGAIAKSLRHLAGLGLLTSDAARGASSGRRVADMPRLLDEYANAVADHRNRTPRILLHGLWPDPAESLSNDLAPKLDQARVRWAATGQVAADLMAPYLTLVPIIELYVSADVFDWPQRLADVLGGRVVEKGHRAEVRPLTSSVTSTAGETIHGVRCAPAARVYADLRALGGRAAEAAQHLREVRHVGTGT